MPKVTITLEDIPLDDSRIGAHPTLSLMREMGVPIIIVHYTSDPSDEECRSEYGGLSAAQISGHSLLSVMRGNNPIVETDESGNIAEIQFSEDDDSGEGGEGGVNLVDTSQTSKAQKPPLILPTPILPTPRSFMLDDIDNMKGVKRDGN